MTVLVLSDLHLGTAARTDLLRRPEVRAKLLERLGGIERVVLLGDVLELREQPVAAVLEAALPFFEELGEALGGGAVTIVPGNHDHQLAAPLIESRRMRAPGRGLGLEETAGPGRQGPLAAIARRMPGTELTLAYPGAWLGERTYATHGHYLDCHIEVPRAEVLGIAATARIVRGVPADARCPDDYEAVSAPLYAFTYQLAQAAAPGRRAIASDMSAKLWSRLNRRRPTLGMRVVGGVALPLAIAALNRAGVGSFSADLSGPALRDAGLRAMARVVERLGIDAGHVLFGHTHRAGPLPRDADPRIWTAAGGARLVNTGTWVYEPQFLDGTGPENPYWPGTCALLGEDGEPRLVNCLGDLPQDELAAA